MEFKGKTVEEAIETGLKELGITEENALVEVLEEPVKGLFGRLKGEARVEISKKESDSERAESFVKDVLNFMNFKADTELSEKDGSTVITLVGEDSSNIIGYRGEVLDAIQTLAGAVMNIGKKEYKKVVVDCENYREKREDTLVRLAKKLEEKATEMKREVILEPMSPYERRIIHTTLAESETVTTRSDGKEPNRYVVIVPNDKDEFAKPYNAGRNHSDKNQRGGRDNHFKSHGRGGRDSKFNRSGKGYNKGGNRNSSPSKKSSFGFGTYLGNSLKDKD